MPTKTTTFATNDVLTANDLNALAGAWNDYTPTLVQSVTVTKTIVKASYIQFGKLVMGTFLMTATSAGSAGSWLLAGLPVAAASGQSVIGSGNVYDVSATTHYPCTLFLYTGAVSVSLRRNDAIDLTPQSWGSSPNIALASGDSVYGFFMYEAA